MFGNLEPLIHIPYTFTQLVGSFTGSNPFHKNYMDSDLTGPHTLRKLHFTSHPQKIKLSINFSP